MAKMRDGAQWLSNHYAANDYYCEGEHVVGCWAGRGAEALGILGQSIEPQNAAFLRIFSGQTPGGEDLKQRDSDIIGYDFQCSAQKSVSIMAILGGDERLFEAHRTAVTQAYEKLETLACVQGRDEQGNKRRTTTGVLCSARFEHDTSRALDPHIHTHFATANFSIGQAGKRYALETHDMVKAIRYAGKIYQSALRRNVEDLGYRTRDKFDDKGQLEGFEIDGIRDELCEKYSQRRGEIEDEIAAFQAEHGREPTAAEIHVIAKETGSQNSPKSLPKKFGASNAHVRRLTSWRRSRVSNRKRLTPEKKIRRTSVVGRRDRRVGARSFGGPTGNICGTRSDRRSAQPRDGEGELI
jgi:conjugative relaxase-like TrwC/TraI family protein